MKSSIGIIVNIRPLINLTRETFNSYPLELRAQLGVRRFLNYCFGQPRGVLHDMVMSYEFIPHEYIDVTKDLIADDLDFLMVRLDEVLVTQVSKVLDTNTMSVVDINRLIIIKYMDKDHGLFALV
jgi:hypothetical protein